MYLGLGEDIQLHDYISIYLSIYLSMYLGLGEDIQLHLGLPLKTENVGLANSVIKVLV